MDRDRRQRNSRSSDAYGTEQVTRGQGSESEGQWASIESFNPGDVSIESAELLDNDVSPGDDVGIRIILENDNDVKASCDVILYVSGAYSGKLASGTNPPANGTWRLSKTFGAPMGEGSYTIEVDLENVSPA